MQVVLALEPQLTTNTKGQPVLLINGFLYLMKKENKCDEFVCGIVITVYVVGTCLLELAKLLKKKSWVPAVYKNEAQAKMRVRKETDTSIHLIVLQ